MEKVIRTLNEPTLTVDDLIVDTTSRGVYNARFPMVPIGENLDQMKSIGLRFPMIVINGVTYKEEFVDALRIDSTGKYPTVSLKIKTEKQNFKVLGLPKDGDLISIFYRSGNDEIKPIRCDFDIVEMVYSSTEEVLLHGVLRVPTLFSDLSWSYEGNSIETLQKFAQKMGLGFATNELKTDDKMNWVSPNDPSEIFMDKVTRHSYKDESTFFESFIDHNYILNFINVRTQLSNDIENKINEGIYKFRDVIEANKLSPYYAKDENHLVYTHPTLISNWHRVTIPEFKIIDYNIIENTSRVSLEDGYKKYVHTFDTNLNNKFEAYTELINSKKSDKFLLNKGRLSEEVYRKQNRHSWEGITYSLPYHNTHKFYTYANLHNKQNLQELEKMKLEVTLQRPNFNIHRYMSIPVILYEYGANISAMFDTKKKIPGRHDVDLPLDAYILNQMLSGFYVVQGISFEFYGNYNSGPIIIQKLTLVKTEWNKAVYIPNDTPKGNVVVATTNQT